MDSTPLLFFKMLFSVFSGWLIVRYSLPDIYLSLMIFILWVLVIFHDWLR